MLKIKRLSAALLLALALVGMSACNQNSEDNANNQNTDVQSSTDEVETEYLDGLAIQGEYMDSVSERAGMVVYYIEDEEYYSIQVIWADSAMVDNEWRMSAKDDGDNHLKYEDCTYNIVTYESDTEFKSELQYEGGKGYFTFDDGKLLWDGAEDDGCKGCIFEKME